MNTAVATQWNIDNAHSEVQFKVRHMMVSTVTGFFKDFSGTVQSSGEGFSGAKVEFTAKVASINTNNEQRDGHLRSADFFDADNYPDLVFKGNEFTQVSSEDYLLKGDLTIRGVTKPIELKVSYFGTMVDPYGNTKAGFEVTGEIIRTDYGLKWNAALETGGVMVSEKVRLLANIQLQKA